MGRTEIPGGQILDGGVSRDDLDTTTAGKAVISKVVAGTNVTLTWTGVDAGTGDVTVNFSGPPAGPAGFSDAFTMGMKLADTTALPTDAATYSMNLSQGDINAAQTETIKLALPPPNYADTSTAPSDAPTLKVVYVATSTFTAPNTGNYTIQCWGGGRGGGAGTTTNGGGGGAGGDYAQSVLALIATTTYTVTVGAATTTGGVGNDSWFNTSTTIRAKGGASASTTIGTTTFVGGPGAVGAALSPGGVGGGGAGSAGNGATPTGGTPDGGAGGGASAAAGLPGTARGGGGGGGGYSLTAPGAASIGARGEIRIAFTP